MEKKELWRLKVLARADPLKGQTLARRALEVANGLPKTAVDGVIQEGFEAGFLERVRSRVYKLVGEAGRRSPERR